MLDLHDVGMLQHAEELHLAEDAGRVRDVLEDVGDLLDGHLLPGLVVRRRTHDPVTPLADHLVDGEAVSLAVLGEEALVVHRRGRRHLSFSSASPSLSQLCRSPERPDVGRVCARIASPTMATMFTGDARPRACRKSARIPPLTPLSLSGSPPINTLRCVDPKYATHKSRVGYCPTRVSPVAGTSYAPTRRFAQSLDASNPARHPPRGSL